VPEQQPVPDEALIAALDTAMADSALPRYGQHRAAVQERYRRVLEAAAPFIRAPLEAENARLRERIALLEKRAHPMDHDSPAYD
jgi:hypothetical protein